MEFTSLLESYCATKADVVERGTSIWVTVGPEEVLPASKRLQKGPEATAIPNLQAVIPE